MDKTQRVVFFVLFSLPISAIWFCYTPVSNELNTAVTVVIFSSIIMLSFVSLFLEHYFTRPTDVVSSSIAIILMLAPIKDDLGKLGNWYWYFLLYVFFQGAIALTALLLVNKKEPASSTKNSLSLILNKFCIHFGRGKILFFGMFLLMLVFDIDDQTKDEFLILSLLASIWLLVDPKKAFFILNKKLDNNENELGEIFGVQSRNTFLVKLYEERQKINRFDLVEFKYSMDQAIRRGLVIDNYFLNECQWVKVLCSNEIQSHFSTTTSEQIKHDNVLYKLDVARPDFIDRFVGVVVEGSTIQKIKFEYSQKLPIWEGELLNINIRNQSILYQVIQGVTDSETLELKNKSGFIVGEAVQLGVWDDASSMFKKYGWLPDINSSIYIAEKIKECDLTDFEYQIGHIPNSNYPSIVNLNELVTHHTAIMGITGSGKSVFARNLIRELYNIGTKIIIIDLSSEYKDKLHDLGPKFLINIGQTDFIKDAMRVISQEKEKFANQQDKHLISREEDKIETAFKASITSFYKSDKNISLFELPDLTNTSEIFDYTRRFFKALFDVAKGLQKLNVRVCVVLEEAHTIVPEWNFSGSSDKNSGALINSIAQIALQGRKYQVGFMVIGQRTANISKTILTQCNTIIAFQQFDKTSTDFLSNYFGTDLSNFLPNLEQRHAIVAGKALRSNVPMIMKVPDISEISIEELDDVVDGIEDNENDDTGLQALPV